MYCSNCGNENHGHSAGTAQKAKKGKKLWLILGLGLLAAIVLAGGVIWWLRTPERFKGKAEVLIWCQKGYNEYISLQSDGELLVLYKYADSGERHFTCGGIIESAEMADKDTMLYHVRVTDWEDERELNNRSEVDEMFVKMPKDASKGRLEGTWGFALMRKVSAGEGDENKTIYNPYITSMIYTGNGKLKMGQPFAPITFDEKEYDVFKAQTDNWKNWTKHGDYKEVEIDGAQWSETDKKGHYRAEEGRHEFELKVLPKE